MRAAVLTALAAVAVVLPSRALSQDAGPGTGGAVAALRAATVLASPPRRVLMIGAHPDDEYTDLIALLSRGGGVETAYLSLTRGEGGQNLIGNELGVGLGILRTDELLAARAVDGGRQFFTRAFDFGFSKNAEETFRFWPHDSLLLDVVRVIRAFKPQVIVSVWSGTARDGHGQHTVAGIIAREAFDVAADSTRFPKAGPAFRVSKFYLAPYTLAPDTPMLVLDGGRIEPASGLTMHQLAARSRSRHRSQDMGTLEEPGPWPVRVALTALAPGVTAAPTDSMFAGIAPTPLVGEGNWRAASARLAAAGIVVDAYASHDIVAAGDSTTVTMLVVNGSSDTITARLRLSRHDWPGGADARPCGDTVRIAPGARHDCKFNRGRGRYSQPFFLERPTHMATYQFDESPSFARSAGAPFEDEPFAIFMVSASGKELGATTVRIRGRTLNQALGEVRRPIAFVPRIAIELQPTTTLWRRGARTRTFEVHLEHLARGATNARVGLVGPPGWRVGPGRDVAFDRAGERLTVPFTVTAPAGLPDTTVEFRAFAVVGRDTLRQTLHRIEYPHVPRRVYFTDATAQVAVAPITFPDVRRTGYVRGAADMIPEALADGGLKLRVLDDAALESSVLDSLDVLVIGPRAYEVSDAVRRAHPRIMAWVDAGGTLIVQYQQYQYIRGGFTPRPFTISQPHDRITDESAPVTVLDPAHVVFRYPNAISAEDFRSWRQERGLYFAGTWDPAWVPLLEMNDPGEPPRRGALLITDLGKGRVVYSGLAFFRQIPAAVPGAWRLFANLLALGEPRAR